jgi:hypothetical protein
MFATHLQVLPNSRQRRAVGVLLLLLLLSLWLQLLWQGLACLLVVWRGASLRLGRSVLRQLGQQLHVCTDQLLLLLRHTPPILRLLLHLAGQFL